MKKKAIFFLIVFGVFGFIAVACNKSTSDFCDGAKKPLIERSFVIEVKAQYADLVPYQGDITLDIFKEYCDGTQSGFFNESGNGDAEGVWFSGMQFVYKFANTQDFVDVRIKISNRVTYEVGSIHEIFYYDDVKDFNYGIYKPYEITLPWKSTD